MAEIEKIHKCLLVNGHIKVVGVSMPNSLEYSIKDYVLHFEGADGQEEREAYTFLKSLDGLDVMPGVVDVPRLLELVSKESRFSPVVKANLLGLEDALKKVVANKDLLQGFWNSFKADSGSYGWLTPKVAAIVETLALDCNVPLADTAPDLSKVADIESFVSTAKSSPKVGPYLVEMSTALSLIAVHIADPESIPLLIPYWETLKAKTSMDASVVTIIEDAASLYNIPIIDLGS